MNVEIAGQKVGPGEPVYFIADIAANHCGELSIAKELIHACAESGVDAVKMQNFTAATIVSDYGFKHLQGVETHQSKWKQSVFDSYDAASIPLSWTEELKSLCDQLGMAYFTSPYSIELVEAVAPHVSAFKLGSGDITWLDEIRAMAGKDVPLLIATGASTMPEVERAMQAALEVSGNVLLMQCNTEYTAKVNESREERYKRFEHINLKVLETYAKKWPGVPLGLSDHTHGCMTVLGAVGLYDCCAVEKHFTFDNTREGQDHAFSMTPKTWLEMVEETRALKSEIASVDKDDFQSRLAVVNRFVDDPKALKLAIGNGEKKLEENEVNTVIVQRRAVRATRDLAAGEVLSKDDLFPLRPCPEGAVSPADIDTLVGKKLTRNLVNGEHFLPSDVE